MGLNLFQFIAILHCFGVGIPSGYEFKNEIILVVCKFVLQQNIYRFEKYEHTIQEDARVNAQFFFQGGIAKYLTLCANPYIAIVVGGKCVEVGINIAYPYLFVKINEVSCNRIEQINPLIGVLREYCLFYRWPGWLWLAHGYLL